MLRTFNVERTAQAAAVLLRETEGQRLPALTLAQLLYLADRESIQETNFPITGDDPYALEHGPVLNVTLGLMSGRATAPDWNQWFRNVGYDDVELVGDPGYRKLSRYELRKLKEIAAHYAGRERWEVAEELRRLPEWREAYQDDGSSSPIEVRKLLEALGLGDRAEEILSEAASYQSLERTPTAVG